MTIVAEKYDFVIGIDTHARSHTYAIIDAKNYAVIQTQSFPTSASGMARALAWIDRGAPGRALAAVEGTGSYGRLITTALEQAGLPVAEVKPPPKAARNGRDKSDPLDARAAAHGVLRTDVDRLLKPRASGHRNALRVLLASRRELDADKTRANNSLHALLRSNDLDIDARKTLTIATIRSIATWRERATDDTTTRVCRAEARRLAKKILDLRVQLHANEDTLEAVIKEFVPAVLDIYGVGPISGAQIIASYSHRGRIHSEAAFAKLSGTAPLLAASGNTSRHRLSRYGDRQLNSAITRVANTRLSHDKYTQEFRDQHLALNQNKRDIRRVLKRYIARELYRKLQHIMA